MSDLEKARYIIERIENDENFDLIDYYAIEKKTPIEFIKGIKAQLNPYDSRILNSFASRNVETSEWKERHYIMFFNDKFILSGVLVTKEAKEKIINDLLDLGLSINDRTVRVMMRRYVRELLERDSTKKVLTY